MEEDNQPRKIVAAFLSQLKIQLFGKKQPTCEVNPKVCFGCGFDRKKKVFTGFIAPTTFVSDCMMCSACREKFSKRQAEFWAQTEKFYQDAFERFFKLIDLEATKVAVFAAIDNLILAGKVIVLTPPPTEKENKTN